tara:strand:- start:3898 stop:4248 length:351 start_codon:yes stop_codon:yes gene_type:complete
MIAFASNFFFLIQNSPLLWIWAFVFCCLGIWQAHGQWGPWKGQIDELERENIDLKASQATKSTTANETNSTIPSPPTPQTLAATPASFDRYNRRRKFGEEPTFGCRACEKPSENQL